MQAFSRGENRCAAFAAHVAVSRIIRFYSAKAEFTDCGSQHIEITRAASFERERDV